MSAPDLDSGDEMPSRIGVEPVRPVRVIAAHGDLDLSSSLLLRAQLDALIADGVTVIVLDCSRLDYIDSTGLGVLVSALKQTANRSGTLALADVNERVRRVLRVTGLMPLFSIFATVDEACSALAIVAAA